MERAEKIKKLCMKMNVSEQEADGALRACNEDILDAALYLEALGRVRMPSGGYYSEMPRMEAGPAPQPQRHASESLGEALRRFGRWFVDVLKKGMDNYFEVWKNGVVSFRIPLTIFVILLLTPLMPFLAALIVIGLFFDYSYHFAGPNLKENGTCNRAAAGCSNVARDIRRSFSEGAERAGANREYADGGFGNNNVGNGGFGNGGFGNNSNGYSADGGFNNNSNNGNGNNSNGGNGNNSNGGNGGFSNNGNGNNSNGGNGGDGC